MKKTQFELFTEYQQNPIGLVCDAPRFSWRTNDPCAPAQTAVQLIVSDNMDDINRNIGNVWDSQKIDTDQSTNLVYQGKPLADAHRYYWKIKLWTAQEGCGEFSDVQTFEMGLHTLAVNWITSSKFKATRCPLFRKEFNIDKEILYARCYIVGLGYYELSLNGQKVDDYFLHPGWTDTTKTILCTTHDVTRYLVHGDNALGLMLATNFNRGFKFALKLAITYCDGTTQTISSDTLAGWYFSLSSPMCASSIYDGELYDARLAQKGWNTASFPMDPAKWQKPLFAEPPTGKLKDHSLEPIKIVEQLHNSTCIKEEENKKIYDVGYNMAGWMSITLKGSAGSSVTLRYAEDIFPDLQLNTGTLRNAKATDTYILSGDGIEEYQPRFTYHGFRYVEICTQGDVDILTRTACVVRSAVKPTGEFSCSDPLVNQIEQMVYRTEAGNLHSIPTDCPQRDERLGWLNDVTVRAEQALYHFDLSNFYKKWLGDIQDAQGATTGAITDTAPFIRYGAQPADPVSAAYLVIPYLMYHHYADKQIIETFFDDMARWQQYLLQVSDDYIISYSYYGDWASPSAVSDSESLGAGAVSSITPGDYVSTAYFYYNAILLQKMASYIGKTQQAAYYASLSEDIKRALLAKYFDQATCNFSTGSQAANTLAVYFNLVEEPHKAAVVKNIVQDIQRNNISLTTGNQCTKYIYEVLTQNGYIDLAYQLATKTEYPSIGFMIAQGATTVWERWETMTDSEMNSHNHPMHGAFAAWFYKMLAGIQIAQEGYDINHFYLCPYLPAALTQVYAKYDSVKGAIISAWKKSEGQLIYQFTIPWNTKATLCLPLPYQNSVEVLQNGTIMPTVSAQGTGLCIQDNTLTGTLCAGEYTITIR